MSFLTINNLSRKENGNLVVNNISLAQEPFEKIAIAGATGSGKTSLLKMVAGLVQPTSGDIHFKEQKVIGPLDQLIPHHPGIAYLSQHFELFNNYWVHEVLEMANKLPEEEAQHIYAICRIEHLLEHRTNQLSGGEKQRIALARLLSTSPQLLLLDEPFSNLDAVHKSIIKSVIKDIGEQLQITCIMVSHDALDILSWADRIVVMKDGEIIQQGTPEQVYHKPINEYAAGLLGEYSILDKAVLNLLANNKKLLVRPEQFEIVQEDSHLVSGILQNIVFFGSYYILEVMLGQQLMKVRTASNDFILGNPIYLSLSNNDAWSIQ